MRVYLVSTHSPDVVEGPARLLNVYNAIKPSIILEQNCRADLLHVDALCSGLLRRISESCTDAAGVQGFVQLMRETLSFGHTANVEYATANGVPHFLIQRQGSTLLRELRMRRAMFYATRGGGPPDMQRWSKRLVEWNQDHVTPPACIKDLAVRCQRGIDALIESAVNQYTAAGKNIVCQVYCLEGTLDKRLHGLRPTLIYS